MTLLASGSVSTLLKASRLAPCGIRSSDVGRAMLRGSIAIEKIQMIGKRTVKAIASNARWARMSSIRSCLVTRCPLSALGIGPALQSAHHPVLAERDDQQDQEYQHAERRRDPIESAGINQLECLRDQDLGLAERSAGGDEVDDIELVEGQDRA